MNNLRKNFFLDFIYLFCFIFLIEFNVSAGDTIIMPSLSIDSLDKVVIVDRLIAQRAYENIKANLPADSGLDFNEIEERIRFYEAD